MLSSKSTGWMLIMGIIAFVVMFISQTMQGDTDGTAGAVAWAASSNDWQIVMPMRMVTIMLMLIFTVGFVSLARSISESNSVISIGAHFALAALILMWVGFISQLAGFDTASDSTEPASAAHALVKFSNMSFWFGGAAYGVSFLLVGIKAYLNKVGTPASNGLLALLGLIASAGSFVSWFLWMIGFGLGLVVLAIIGLQKIMRE